ncbi:MAG: hypothetical protein KKA05_03280 [Alphaproteobacteria bacterium]|nr:hypothetical protein [Alphaproteobacteria bacterium]MBU0859704.1 hypothetical protein [Alphaproteobacteria bacterium]
MSVDHESDPKPSVLQRGFAAAGTDESGDDTSQRLQAQQDEQAAEAHATQDKISAVGKPARHDGRESLSSWARTPAGFDVAYCDDEINIYFDKRRGPNEQQVQRAIEVAMQKGWKTIYLFDKAGKPDLRTAQAFNQVIAKMGLQEQIHCCTEPEKMCGHISEMKKTLRGAAMAGAGVAAAAAAVGVGAALMQQMSPS